MTRLCAGGPSYEDGICETLADKIIDKEVFSRRSTSKDKVKREILLHKDLIHPNVVRFHHFFSDGEYNWKIVQTTAVFQSQSVFEKIPHLKCISLQKK